MNMKQTLIRCLHLAAVCLASGLSGCASTPRFHHVQDDQAEPGLGQVIIEDASYREVFETTRQVLTFYRFAINRVDATRGMISTFPKRTLGIGSIWDHEQSSLKQEWEDFANQHERTIRVMLRHTAHENDSEKTEIKVVVEVLLHRIRRPHWRIEPQSIGLSTYAQSRDTTGQIEPPFFREPIGHDLELAQRIARHISSQYQ